MPALRAAIKGCVPYAPAVLSRPCLFPLFQVSLQKGNRETGLASKSTEIIPAAGYFPGIGPFLDSKSVPVNVVSALIFYTTAPGMYMSA